MMKKLNVEGYDEYYEFETEMPMILNKEDVELFEQ